MLERQDNRCREAAAASVGESGRRSFLCRGPHLARVCPDRKKPSDKGSKGPQEITRGKKGAGKGKGQGCGAVTMAMEFTAVDEPV